MDNLELQAEIARWQRCRLKLIEERDGLQEQIAECDRMLAALYRR